MSESKVVLLTGVSSGFVPLTVRALANVGHAAGDVVATANEQRYAGLVDEVSRKLAELAPADADSTEVARQIVRVASGCGSTSASGSPTLLNVSSSATPKSIGS